ncbi:hypothetical protein HMPREF9554_00400 [Treponema phagedenis F0421]|nr:hypothetical protein HMPREF9554_00400 [Treponema phagedenis F0421]
MKIRYNSVKIKGFLLLQPSFSFLQQNIVNSEYFINKLSTIKKFNTFLYLFYKIKKSLNTPQIRNNFNLLSRNLFIYLADNVSRETLSAKFSEQKKFKHNLSTIITHLFKN